METTIGELYTSEGQRPQAAAEWATAVESIVNFVELSAAAHRGEAPSQGMVSFAIEHRINAAAMNYVADQMRAKKLLEAMRIAFAHGWMLMGQTAEEAARRMTAVGFEEAAKDVITTLRTFAQREVN